MYPIDEFGVLDKDVEYNSATYESYINENNKKKNRIKIITIKKNKNNSK